MTFCCEHMKNELEDGRIAMSYSPKFRSCSIYVIDWFYPKEKIRSLKDIIHCRAIINYCPWCGKKLPTDLGDIWFDTLRTEYGLENPCDDKSKIPEEFKSDKWWKKRGL